MGLPVREARFLSGIPEMRSDDLDEGVPDMEPLAAKAGPGPQSPAPDFASLVKNLGAPVVIMNRLGRICFMNLSAERVLGGGLKKRLEAHLNNQPQRPVVSQVRFALANGAEIILRIRLSGMKWMGEEATQVSLRDVTAYIAIAQRLSRKIAKLKERRRDLPDWQARLETQVRSLAAERDSAYAASSQRLAQETARFQKSQQEAQAQCDRLEAQLKEMTAHRDRVEMQLEAALGRLRQAEEERQRLEQQAEQAREENEKLRQKIAAALQAAEASSEAQESFDESDPLRVGKVEKASAKRRRELESGGAADANGEPPEPRPSVLE
jgi:DNA repair exonuclease SbcCD ATPase subunit